MHSIDKIVIAGGSGHLGRVIASFYKDHVKEVVILSRGSGSTTGNIRLVHWDGKTSGEWINELEGAAMLINLAGKNVNCRYHEKNKVQILSSRTDSTTILGYAIRQCKTPPKLWIQSASATIYRHAEDRPMDEETGELGEGFSVDVCRRWEKIFWEQEALQTRKVLLRIGIVLGKGGGAFPRLLNMVRSGLGGRQGNGKQYVSWIHEADVVNCIDWIYRNERFEGVFNCTSPFPVMNNDLMRTFRKVYGISVGFPAPAWLLEIGAWLIGTETELILKSRWVLPTRLTKAGYAFRYPHLQQALSDLVSRRM